MLRSDLQSTLKSLGKSRCSRGLENGFRAFQFEAPETPSPRSMSAAICALRCGSRITMRDGSNAVRTQVNHATDAYRTHRAIKRLTGSIT
jgi:hypothetical protein